MVNSTVSEKNQQHDVALLEKIITESRVTPEDESYQMLMQGLEYFLAQVLSDDEQDVRVDKVLVDVIMAQIDEKLSLQLDEILHHPEFQRIEAAWRGLKFLTDRTDFRENIEIGVINVSKEILREDFVDNPDLTLSGLYKHVYTSEYGQFGGKPVAAIVGDYYFGPESDDIELLKNIAAVSSMSHAPFIASAKPQFFDIDSFEQFSEIKDLHSILSSPRFNKWHAFRESEDSRQIGLVAPRFLLRSPYVKGSAVKSFEYEENVAYSHNSYLWGNAAYAFASRLSESFANYRWCPNIVGPVSGGMVDNLPEHYFESMGEVQLKISTETLISDRKEFELADEGFITLVMKKGSNSAVFFSANSVQKPKFFGNTKEGRSAELNYKLGTQLPYIFIVSRLAHYIKVLQREQLGSWKSKSDIEQELNRWLRQYISDQENPPSSVRSRRPLKSAKINVSDVDGDPGWYAISLNVVPHFKYMGANFTLSLKGRLEKN